MKDAVTVDEHRLTALHTALLNGGVFVYVPKNVVVEDPIQYVVLHDNENASLFNHAIIVTEESAEVLEWRITFQLQVVKVIKSILFLK